MVSANSFSCSLWYFGERLQRIKIEWSEEDLVKISNDTGDIELYGVIEEDSPIEVEGIARKRGEKSLGEFWLKKQNLSRCVDVRLGGRWLPAHIINETDDKLDCVILYSKTAVEQDVLSVILTVREDRIRRGRMVDYCEITSVDDILMTILEYSATEGEELMMLSYLSTRIQSLICSERCNLLWKRLTLLRWPLLSLHDLHIDHWRLFYLSRQQFDYPAKRRNTQDYVVDIQTCSAKFISDTITTLNSGKLRFQYRCPFRWDAMKIIESEQKK
eukprot:UN32226